MMHAKDGDYSLFRNESNGAHLLVGEAIATNDIRAIEAIKEFALDVNKAGDDKKTALHVFCEQYPKTRGYTEEFFIESLNKLKEAGADFNARDKYGNTPLMLLGGKAGTKALSALKNNGADLNAKNDSGETIVHTITANLHPSIEVLQFIEDQGVPLNVVDNQGNTPFHKLLKDYGFSIDSERLFAVAKLLHKAGVNLKALNAQNLSAVSLMKNSVNTADRNVDIAEELKTVRAIEQMINLVETSPQITDSLRRGDYSGFARFIKAARPKDQGRAS